MSYASKIEELIAERDALRADNEALRAVLAELLDEADSGIATCPLTRKKARALLTPNARLTAPDTAQRMHDE